MIKVVLVGNSLIVDSSLVNFGGGMEGIVASKCTPLIHPTSNLLERDSCGLHENSSIANLVKSYLVKVKQKIKLL